MNVVCFTGRLTETPELKMTTTNKAVCSFRIAVQRPREKDVTDFFTCVAWNKDAEFVAHYFRKGQRIEVTGAMTTRQYQAKDNRKVTLYEVRCEKVDFGESKKEAESENIPPAAFTPNNDIDEFTELPTDDSDLPF